MSSTRLATLLLAILAVVVVALVVGPGALDPWRAAAALGRGLFGPHDPRDVDLALVWTLRLPRVLLVALVGAALASAGALTQGLFRNPLADPSVLGVSLGAALVAVIGLFLGLDRAGIWVTPVLAATGAAATLAVLWWLTSRGHDGTTLLLAGVAIAAACGAATSSVLALAGDRPELGVRVIRWLMGSFEGRSWGHLGAAVIPIVAGVALAIAMARDLDGLLLGDEIAASLGVELATLRRGAIAAVAILIGTATAMCGVIGFVGLVVPHVVRRWLGSGHHGLVIGSALIGALLLMIIDTLGRAADLPLPPGVVTSLLGAPAFLWILLRTGARRLA